MPKDDKILHIGVPRKSGRYPWGSGDDPHQSNSFLNQYVKLLKDKKTNTEIAREMGITTTQLRDNIRWAREEEKEFRRTNMAKDREGGMTYTQIAEKYGTSDGTVRNLLKNTKQGNTDTQLENIKKAIKEGVDNTGYLDVGIGVELQLGVPRTRFNAVVNKLVEEEGYHIHNVSIKRLNDPDKPTTVKTLTKDPDSKNTYMNQDKIKPLKSYSDDRGQTLSPLKPPASINQDRLKIRYAEDGGEGKDGVIELRRGTEDLDMGAAHYAQVRIKVGDDRYLKGMAIYGDPKDFPEGVDLIFNTNKSSSVAKMDVLKKTKEGVDPIEVFGSSITKQNASKVLNIVNQEGEWDTWKKDLSSQFLSKQPVSLIKERLEETRKDLKKEFDDLNSLTNPIVKEHLMSEYANGLNSKAAKLNAKGLPKTKGHVILPFPDMNPNEIYAPHYDNGETVVLVRYPHGGVFELPQVRVNNKNAKAREVLGTATDAIGIHPSVAKKLSGADFDGDTVYVIPNNDGKIKTSRTLKELKNFDPMMYKVDHDTITPDYKQKQMGLVSNLITDMTIKGATEAEIARAVKHSMVVIDSEKHKLDWKQSEADNGIKALKKAYQSHINPDTGQPSLGASTLISRSKRVVAKAGTEIDPLDTSYNSQRKKQTDISDPNFKPEKYSSGTKVEKEYVTHIQELQKLKRMADSEVSKIVPPKYSPEAARAYKNEVDSLNRKLEVAKSNAPREREAQILSNKIYYTNRTPDMSKEAKKKLRDRSITRARLETGANGREASVSLTFKEWEAIQARAISNTKLKEVLRYSDSEEIKQLAMPRKPKLSDPKIQRAQGLIDSGYTYAEVSERLGITITSAMLKGDD